MNGWLLFIHVFSATRALNQRANIVISLPLQFLAGEDCLPTCVRKKFVESTEAWVNKALPWHIAREKRRPEPVSLKFAISCRAHLRTAANKIIHSITARTCHDNERSTSKIGKSQLLSNWISDSLGLTSIVSRTIKHHRLAFKLAWDTKLRVKKFKVFTLIARTTVKRDNKDNCKTSSMALWRPRSVF